MTKHIVNNKLVDMNEAEQQAYDERMLDNQNKALPRALDVLRDKRNNLLAETDWMASSDVTMSDDWKTYRQALRDITSGLDTVEKVNTKLTVDNNTESETYGKYINFPTKPSGE